MTLSARPAGQELGRSGTRPIELTIVLESAIRPWRYPPEMEFQYGDWLRADYVAGFVPSAAPNPDLAVLLEMARRDGRAVAGPPPARLREPVPWQDLVASLVHGLDGLMQDLETDTRNVILTLARIWITLATGEIRRKDKAAAWAAERLPPEFAAVLERRRRSRGDWVRRADRRSGPRALAEFWGITMNIATRMEASGVPDRIHLAKSTRDLLPDDWSFDERESIDVKGVGRMTTYLLALDEANSSR